MFRLNLYFIRSIQIIHPSPIGTSVLYLYSHYTKEFQKMYSKITCIILKKRTKIQLISPYLKLGGFTLLFDNWFKYIKGKSKLEKEQAIFLANSIESSNSSTYE